MTAALIIGGLVLLALGGEFVVRGSVSAARTLRVSPVVIGVVLMGFGTSLPELVTSVQSAMTGAPGIALGNVVGSNIANLLLIAGAAALLSSAAVNGALIRRDGMVMLGTTIAIALLIFYDGVSAVAGGALLVVLAVYLGLAVTGRTGAGKAAYVEEAEETGVGGGFFGSLPGALVLFVIGLVTTLIGARFLVEGAVAVAESFQVPEALIGATIVAVGTSLPELAATIAAALRSQGAMAIGNVIGSNIFNVCAIVGITALVAPLPAPPSLAAFDIWYMIGATIIVLIMALTNARLSRSEGVALLGLYGLYILLTVDQVI